MEFSHYKTSFKSDGATFGEVKPTEWFRFPRDYVPMLCVSGPRAVSYHNGLVLDVGKERPVVRIRIDRVEDGLPVFVDDMPKFTGIEEFRAAYEKFRLANDWVGEYEEDTTKAIAVAAD